METVVMVIRQRDFQPHSRLRRWAVRMAVGFLAAWLLILAAGRSGWLAVAAAVLGAVLLTWLGSGLWKDGSKRGRIQCILTESGLCGPYFGGLWWRFPWDGIRRVLWEQDQDGRRGLVLHESGIFRHRIEILHPALQAALIDELHRRIPVERWSGGTDEMLDSEPWLKMA
jgi:hypothetical protein